MVFTTGFLASYAQSPTVAKNTNEIQFNGYTIRLFETPNQGYGYNVLFHNNIVIHQQKNPFSNSPDGLKVKDDAVKAAKWQIIHLTPGMQSYQMKQSTIPMQVAQQLKITTN